MAVIHDLMDRAKQGDEEAIEILGLFRCRECNFDMKTKMDKCPKCGHPTP